MRFKLIEADTATIAKITPDLISEWRTASDTRRAAIAGRILHNMGKNSGDKCMQVLNAFTHSCYVFGIDPKSNPFIEFVPFLCTVMKVTDRHDEYLNVLVDLVSKGVVPKERLVAAPKAKDAECYLLEPSLYYRNIKEFTYTVNIFENVLDRTKLAKFFVDIKNINASQLYDDRGNIKPAGSKATADDLSTIFGTTESWAGSEGGNNIPLTKVKKKGNPGDIKLTRELRAEADKQEYNGFSDFPEEQKRDGVVAKFKVPQSGDLGPDDWTNSWDPGYYVYDAPQKRWARIVGQ